MNRFPDALKSWRKARRYSQLQLSAEAEVSLRHLSFLETGRANPSVDMVDRLVEALQLPLSARNQMLTAAGFAPRYGSSNWDEAEMAPIRDALDHMLCSHAPYPAIAVDRLWNITAMNGPARLLFAQLHVAQGMSLLEIMVSGGLEPVIENWPDVARHAALRLRTESMAQGGVAELETAAERLMQVEGASRHPAGPVLPTIFRLGELRLSLFATIAQFGTPEDLALDDVKVELYFPADKATEEVLRNLA